MTCLTETIDKIDGPFRSRDQASAKSMRMHIVSERSISVKRGGPPTTPQQQQPPPGGAVGYCSRRGARAVGCVCSAGIDHNFFLGGDVFPSIDRSIDQCIVCPVPDGVHASKRFARRPGRPRLQYGIGWLRLIIGVVWRGLLPQSKATLATVIVASPSHVGYTYGRLQHLLPPNRQARASTEPTPVPPSNPFGSSQPSEGREGEQDRA